MKVIKKYTLITVGIYFLVSIVFNSCNDEKLDVVPISQFSNENVFSNVGSTKLVILGIYQLMTNDEGYSKRLSMYYGVDSDIAKCSGELDNGRRGIARYAATSGNLEIEKPMRNLYAGIERANICIENIPKSVLYKNGSEDEQFEMKRMHGEALTLRALHYYELIRNWGDVPFKLTPSKAGENFELPKTDRDIIYEYIINDLLLAQELVPWRSEVPSDERITKGAVKGLLARICLARGGYSLRRESNTMERGSNHLHYYQIARDQCYEIMQSGEHMLNPDFEDVFITMCELELDTKYGEVMWEVGFGTYESGEVGYYIANKINASSTFGKSDGGVRALPSFYLSYNDLDVRRDHTIAFYEIDADDNHILRDFGETFIGKWRREWMDPKLPGEDKFTGINWPLLRYSDVLLMFAEADNELNNGPSADAINALVQIRERAFRDNEDQIGTIPTTYNEFFDAIVDERAWELAGECLRKHDLIRWNLLDTKLKEMKAELHKIYNMEAPYDNIPPRLVWRNNGTQIEYLNYNVPMDSLQIATRDSIQWPNVAHWGDDMDDVYINAVAEFFEPNRKELLPIHQTIIDENRNLTNDYGY